MSRFCPLAGLTIACLALTACGAPSGESPTQDAPAVEPVLEPYPADALEAVDTSDMWVPYAFETAEMLSAPWDSLPQYVGGVYLGSREDGGIRTFTAVSTSGDALWSAERPAICHDAAVSTTADGRAVAVLADVRPAAGGAEEAAICPILTGYDLETGETIWGPTEAGELAGPGVQVRPTPDAQDEPGTTETVALDPATGDPRTHQPDQNGIGEYHGVSVWTDQTDLVATGPDDAELWRIPISDLGLQGTIGPSELAAPEGYAVVAHDGGDALVELATGGVVTLNAHGAAFDAASRTLVVLEETGMRAVDATGAELWAESVAPSTWIAAAGGVFAYLRDGDAVRVHNVVTGAVAEAYDPEGSGSIVVPAHITVENAAVLWEGERLLLATVPAAPEMGDTVEEPAEEPVG